MTLACHASCRSHEACQFRPLRVNGLLKLIFPFSGPFLLRATHCRLALPPSQGRA